MALDALSSFAVSRETIAALRAFEAEVRRWNTTVNLVSRASMDTMWQRHIVDSAQLFTDCPIEARHWVDLGSGGGFPGMVIAILARESKPDLHVTMVESDQRKAAFLRQTALHLNLEVKVQAKRIECLDPQDADVASARALAPLAQLLGLTVPHLKPTGVALFLKGGRHADEVAAAREQWDFDLEIRPSTIHSDAAVLKIGKIQRAW